MSLFTFILPGKLEDLLNAKSGDIYFVKNVSLVNDIPKELKNSKINLRDEGAEFILTFFDTFYSVLAHGDKIGEELIYSAYDILLRGTKELNKALGFLLEDKESINKDIQDKYQNIFKMLLYVFVETVMLLERRDRLKKMEKFNYVKKKNKSSEDEFQVDKKEVLLALNNILQRELMYFWEDQIVEEPFINLMSITCYDFLQNPQIKQEKEVLNDIFNLLGYLMQAYNHSGTFVIKITQFVKLYEHLVHCVPIGIKQLVENFNFRGLLHDMIEELTEWQTNETHQDLQGAKNCAGVVSSLASLMPKLVMPEVAALKAYLHHEPPNLRISVINVMVEVIIANLTGNELDDEQKQFRNEIFEVLIEHTKDNSTFVRTKVFQQLARLQKDMAIPLVYQLPILETAVKHLYDKSSLARKCAASCVTTFLNCNPFSGNNLSLMAMSEELEKWQEDLLKTKEQIKTPNIDKLMQKQEHWDNILDQLTKEVEKAFSRDENSEEKEDESKENQQQISDETLAELIRMHLEHNEFEEAIQLFKVSLKNNNQNKRNLENEEMNDFKLCMTYFYTTFFEVPTLVNKLNNEEFANIREEDVKKLDGMSRKVEYLDMCVNFLTIIDGALDVMIKMLETTSISDMHEAIEFIIAAYHFNIDRAEIGIYAMIRLMQAKEQDRKNTIVEAFKKIYLFTDSEDVSLHVIAVTDQLIKLVKDLPVKYEESLQYIVADWTAKGILTNNIIDRLWLIFTQHVKVDGTEEVAATILLKMASMGRKTIITKNINLVTQIAFGERGRNNLQFLAYCCEFLSVAYEKVDMNSELPPFKLNYEDQCFQDLLNILISKFFEPVKFYKNALMSGLNFVYKLSDQPDHFAKQLLHATIPKVRKNENPEIPVFVLSRLCQMSGYLALKIIEFMDDTLYKDLKRKENIREKKMKNIVKNNKKKKRMSRTALEASSIQDEDIMEGAQAEDQVAEYILNVMENFIVTVNGCLAKIAPIIVDICKRPQQFNSNELQSAAINALCRFMLVSSTFCQSNISVLFTILEINKTPLIKANIMIHVVDLLSRFPNIIEPWTNRLFIWLNDSNPTNRQNAFFCLSSIILGDKIRAHSHIPKMAAALTDSDKTMQELSMNFFLKLSHKENNVYNSLPDILTYFVEEKISDDILKKTMTMLFDMITNHKRSDSLVARFCAKFGETDSNAYHRNISYCLSLIQYNDKSLRKLIEDFPLYKNLIHDEEIYANFKTIIQNCSKQVVGKPDLKALATELENAIKSVFELRDDGESMPPPPVPKIVKRARKPSKRRKKVTEDSDSDD